MENWDGDFLKLKVYPGPERGIFYFKTLKIDINKVTANRFALIILSSSLNCIISSWID